MLKRFLLVLVTTWMSWGQIPQQLQIQAPPPSMVVGGNGVVVGGLGNSTHYYWIVAVYPIGSMISNQGIYVRQAPDTLSSTNYITVSWSPVLGATSYTVLRTIQNKIPVGACGCMKVTGLTTTTYNDISNTRNAFNVPLNIPPSLGTISIDNIGTLSPTHASTNVPQTIFNLPLINNLPANQITFSDGTVQSTAATSGGTPGGSNTQVQFNDSGAFGGNSNFTFNKTTGVAAVGITTIDAALAIRINGAAPGGTTPIWRYIPSNTNKAPYLARVCDTLFQSTYDSVFMIGLNPSCGGGQDKAGVPSFRFQIEDDFEDIPGHHTTESYFEYRSATGAVSYRPIFWQFDTATGALNNFSMYTPGLSFLSTAGLQWGGISSTTFNIFGTPTQSSGTSFNIAAQNGQPVNLLLGQGSGGSAASFGIEYPSGNWQFDVNGTLGYAVLKFDGGNGLLIPSFGVKSIAAANGAVNTAVYSATNTYTPFDNGALFGVINGETTIGATSKFGVFWGLHSGITDSGSQNNQVSMIELEAKITNTAYTGSRLNYIELFDLSGTPNTLALFKFNATNHSLVGTGGGVATLIGDGPSGSTAGTPQGWTRIYIGSTARYIPFW